MKKILLFFLVTFLSLNSFSQISYEQGYYIDNYNQKIDCLIKNIDWKNNPTQFTYKPSENGEQKTVTIESVKEFGIYNTSKYIRYTVNIDRSSKYTSELSYVKKPIFKKEELFLKAIVEGKANLYLYEDGNLRRYFYSKDNLDVEQLIFKNYKASENKIGTNNRFRQQLWIDLKCQKISINNIEKIDYKRIELVNFFLKYNECSGSEFINFEKQIKKDLFNLTLRPGINSTSLSINNRTSNIRDADFGNELSFRFGVEAEYIMSFNKNKWAVLIEPTYQYFKSEQVIKFEKVAFADYKSIELPIGIRHYFYLNNNSKFFVNGSFVIDFAGKSIFDFGSFAILEIKTGNNLAFGMGYKHKNKYSLELRYFTDRDLFYNYRSWESNYNTLSVIFGYTIF